MIRLHYFSETCFTFQISVGEQCFETEFLCLLRAKESCSTSNREEETALFMVQKAVVAWPDIRIFLTLEFKGFFL